MASLSDEAGSGDPRAGAPSPDDTWSKDGGGGSSGIVITRTGGGTEEER